MKNVIVNSKKISQEDLLEIVSISLSKDIVARGGNSACVVVNFDGEDYVVLRMPVMELCHFERELRDDEWDRVFADGNLSLKKAMDYAVIHEADKAVPILGFIYDKDSITKEFGSAYAKTFVVEKRAKGRELYKKLPNPYGNVEKFKAKCFEFAREYSKIPVQHFEEFFRNMEKISVDLKVDPSKSSNFFYDENEGFSFIDLCFLSHAKLKKIEVAQYIAAQFRDRVKQYGFKFDSPQMQQEYEKNMSLIYQNMAKAFIAAGLSIEECCWLYEKMDIEFDVPGRENI